MLNSLFNLVPLLGLIVPAAVSAAPTEVSIPPGQIQVFTGKFVGNPDFSFEIGGVKWGQDNLGFDRKGPNSFQLAKYTTWRWAEKDKAEHDKLVAGVGAFSLHKKVDGKAGEQLNCDLDGDFKDTTKGVYWVFTWDEAQNPQNPKTEICPEEKNGITLKCKGETDFKPRCWATL